MNTKRSGFSLIELIVAMTIGGIILTSVMGSFLTLSKMRQQLDLTRQIQREINFAVIRIADRIRSQEIYYSPGSDFDSNYNDLPFESSSGDKFKFDSASGKLTMNEEPLFSANLKVQQLKFTVLPEEEDPKIQPSVKIELEVSDRPLGSADPKTSLSIRTTISSRLIQ